jgi:Tol biopolymer transport system component
MQASRFATGFVGPALQVLLLTVPAIGQETTRVSVDSSGAEGNRGSYDPSTSANGQFVAFTSWASNLVAGDTNGNFDVFVHDRATSITERVSVRSNGKEGNNDSGFPSISTDGQIVAFTSDASNLVAGDANGRRDVFVHDRSTRITERVSVDSSGVEGNAISFVPTISADGQFVAFSSYASNLVAGDTNGHVDVFVHDRATGITERVSVDSSGVAGNDSSDEPSISADGQIVAFSSWASNLVAGDTNGRIDAFVHDRSTGITERVSVDSSGVEGNDSSVDPSISADGQIVAFYSPASNLVAGDTNGADDAFVHDRATGITERVSVDSSGVEGNARSFAPSISANAQIVAFHSNASNLVAGDTNGAFDVFVHDRLNGVTERVSVDSSGVEGNDNSGNYGGPSISADGRIVAFYSDASNLVAGDTNSVSDVFVHDRCVASWSNYGAGFPGTKGVPSFTSQADPVLGTTVTLDLANSYGNATVGLLIVGFQRTTIHTNWGSDVLAVPLITRVLVLPAGGVSLSDRIPNDDDLCGFTVDLQAIEADPGAVQGVSFTPGLELVLGH